MKLIEVLNLNTVIKNIIDNGQLELDTLVKFRLLGIMKALEHHVASFEMLRSEKIRAYGQADEEGNIRIDPENKEAIEQFNASLEPLLSSEVKADFEKIKARDIFNKGLPADYLVALYNIIEE